MYINISMPTYVRIHYVSIVNITNVLYSRITQGIFPET